jgi:hypothetical protein
MISHFVLGLRFTLNRGALVIELLLLDAWISPPRRLFVIFALELSVGVGTTPSPRARLR